MSVKLFLLNLDKVIVAEVHGGNSEHLIPKPDPFPCLTDGVQYLAEQAGAYWLIDAIFSHRRREPFQIWTLKKNTDDNGAVLTMQEDSGEPIKVRQEMPFTDFPLDQIKLYLIDGVVLLPSEY
ncbi:DUF6876 family protein [Planctomycetota bacterium]